MSTRNNLEKAISEICIGLWGLGSLRNSQNRVSQSESVANHVVYCITDTVRINLFEETVTSVKQ